MNEFISINNPSRVRTRSCVAGMRALSFSPASLRVVVRVRMGALGGLSLVFSLSTAATWLSVGAWSSVDRGLFGPRGFFFLFVRQNKHGNKSSSGLPIIIFFISFSISASLSKKTTVRRSQSTWLAPSPCSIPLSSSLTSVCVVMVPAAASSFGPRPHPHPVCFVPLGCQMTRSPHPIPQHERVVAVSSPCVDVDPPPARSDPARPRTRRYSRGRSSCRRRSSQRRRPAARRRGT